MASKKCNKCEPKLRYCGEDLNCIGLSRGDTYDKALKNINEIICNQNINSNYTFEDNDCRGFDVFKRTEDNIEQIYSYCQDCCEGFIEGMYWINPDMQFSAPQDWQAYKQNDSSTPSYTVTVSGKYLVTLNTNTVSEDVLGMNVIYGIGVNNILPDFGATEENSDVTKLVRTQGISETSLDFIVQLQQGDVVDLWFKVLFGNFNMDGTHKLIFQKI